MLEADENGVDVIPRQAADGSTLSEDPRFTSAAEVIAFGKKVKTLTAEADATAGDFGIVLTAKERAQARRLMSCVSSFLLSLDMGVALTYKRQPAQLSSKINYSAQLGDAFKSHLDPAKHGAKKRLVTLVPTRWNSEQHCLQRYLDMRDIVDTMTSEHVKCMEYAFSEEEWSDAAKLNDILVVSSMPLR
jgi:hypothetical protein